jgi:hypothetical protein
VEYLIHSILHLVWKGSNITNAPVCSLSGTCTVWNLSLRKLNLIYSTLQETDDVTAQLHALVICFDNRCVIYRTPPPTTSQKFRHKSHTRCSSGLSTHLGEYVYTHACAFEIQISKHWALIGRSMTTPTAQIACVIAQQYSSITSVSLRCSSLTKKSTTLSAVLRFQFLCCYKIC